MSEPDAHLNEPPTAALPAIEESETDRLAAQVTGVEDRVGMTTLWRVTMGLEHWWFVAVGEPGQESPAAAEVDGQLVVLTFTTAERARHFAVQQQMIGPDDDLTAIALPPSDVVNDFQRYQEAQIAGFMVDPHITGYFMPTEQLPIVWGAVMSEGPSPQG